MKKLLIPIIVISLALSSALPAFSGYMGSKYAEFGCRTKSSGLSVLYAESGDESDKVCTEKYITANKPLEFYHEETDPEPMVNSGFDTKGKFYAYVTCDTYAGYMDVNDIVPDEEEYTPEAAYLNSYAVRYRVIAPEGIALRKGPSMIYGEYGRIPYGEEFTVVALDNNESASYGMTNYNGMSGWVNIFDNPDVHTIAYVVDKSSYFTGTLDVINEGVYLVDINTVEGEKYKRLSSDIPVGTTLKFKYYCHLGDDNAAYTEYNGNEGWVIFSSLLNAETYFRVMPYVYDVAYVGSELKTYYKRDDSKSVTGKPVPAGSVVNVNAFYLVEDEEKDIYYYMLYLEYDGEKVWAPVDAASAVGMASGYYMMAYVASDSIKVYRDFNFAGEPLAVLHRGEKLTAFCSLYGKGLYWYYINSGEISGLIRQNDYDFESYGVSKQHALRVDKDGRTVLGVQEMFDEPDVATTKPPEETVTQGKAEEPAKENGFSFKTAAIAAGAVFLAVVIAVSTWTTLRKQKKENLQ